MDDYIDLYQQTKAAQRRAEQAGFPATTAALGRIADMIADSMAQEASMDWGVVVPFAPRAAAPAMSALPIGRQARR